MATCVAGERREEQLSFRQAFRIPLVATVMPACGHRALLGALFSLGIVFVRTLSASDAEFGVLCALFGVGAALGLGVLGRRVPRASGPSASAWRPRDSSSPS